MMRLFIAKREMERIERRGRYREQPPVARRPLLTPSMPSLNERSGQMVSDSLLQISMNDTETSTVGTSSPGTSFGTSTPGTSTAGTSLGTSSPGTSTREASDINWHSNLNNQLMATGQSRAGPSRRDLQTIMAPSSSRNFVSFQEVAQTSGNTRSNNNNQRQVGSTSGGRTNQDGNGPSSSRPRKLTAFQKAKETYQRTKDAFAMRKTVNEAKKKEQQQKRLEEIERRKNNFKNYSKRNSRGQPVMASRMSILLDKIKSSSVTNSQGTPELQRRGSSSSNTNKSSNVTNSQGTPELERRGSSSSNTNM